MSAREISRKEKKVHKQKGQQTRRTRGEKKQKRRWKHNFSAL